jgi:hypothetical protein
LEMIRIVCISLLLGVLCSCTAAPQLTAVNSKLSSGVDAKAAVRSRSKARVERSPHADAIMVVLDTQGKLIRRVDKENWWHDVKQRRWLVKRPFHPGTIDSTHTFMVSYLIEGKSVAAWTVDTRKRTALSSEAPE